MARVKLFSALKGDHWVKPFLRQYRPTLILALLLGLLMFFCASGLMFTSGYLISRAAEMPGNIMLIYVPIVLTRAFGIGRPVFRYAERLTSHNWVLKMTSRLRLKLYTVLEKDAIFFKNLHKTGDILGLLSEDIGHLQNLYLRTIFPTVIAWLVYLFAVILLGCFSWWFALVMVLLLGVVVVLVPLVAAIQNGARQAQRKALKNECYGELTDNVLGVSDWVISNRSADYLANHHKTQRKLRALDQSLEASSRRRSLVLQCVYGVIVVALLLWAGSYFGSAGNGMVNWIAAFVLCFFPLIDAFVPLSDAAVETNTYSDSITRLNELTDTEDAAGGDTRSGPDGPDVDTAAKGPKQRVLRSVHQDKKAQHKAEDLVLETPFILQAKKLTFAYPVTQNPQKSRRLLDGLDLTIKPGEKLALLGRSGSGKSTLVLLLRGDLAPNSGSVSLNGIPTFEFGDGIAQYIGVIQQRTYVFNTALRNNLKIGRQSATDEEVWEALDQVGLKALVEELPCQLDTVVDEAGLSFSGGERHRIALARVLLQDVPIVILDEPTVGLDPLTEKALLETLLEVLKDKTVLLITHHLLGAAMMDRVLFLEAGNITIDGSPTELAVANPYYQALLAFDKGGLARRPTP